MACVTARSLAKRAALLALLLLVAVPAAAQGRTFQVDGRVAGPPIAKGRTVTVPLQLTARAGRALKVGTRRVRVRFRRARLPLVGAAGRRRLAPRALQPRDRLKGVTSLSKKGRLRLRRRARPTLKLERPRVIRKVRRARGAPAPPIAPGLPARTPEQIVRDIGTRATMLSVRIGRFGSLTQQIERLLTLRLPVGLAGVTLALGSLTTALEERASTDPAFEPLIADVEALVPAAEWLGTAMGAVNTSLGSVRTFAMLGDAVETLAVESAVLATQIELLSQFPGLVAQLTAIDDALRRIEGSLASVEAASGSLGARTSELNAGLASLTDAVGALAATVQEGGDLASTGAGLDALAGDVAGIGSGFAALQTSVNELGPPLDSLHADAVALEAMVAALEAFGLGGG
jgi:hypothetical protein